MARKFFQRYLVCIVLISYLCLLNVVNTCRAKEMNIKEIKNICQKIESSWEKSLSSVPADEGTLLYLPYPYTTPAGKWSQFGTFPELYGNSDAPFANMGLLIQGKIQIAKWNVDNCLYMIEKYGFVLNGNRTFYLTRSQIPMLMESVISLFKQTKDFSWLEYAYRMLKKDYTGYWTSGEHLTNTGLSRCFDKGDPSLSPNLASEAESWWDFTPRFEGDARNFNPVDLNSLLYMYAVRLSEIAGMLGLGDEKESWKEKADSISELINKYCWDEDIGFYFDYDFVQERRGLVKSIAGYYPLWAGIANKEQARRVVENLKWFETTYGVVVTDKLYPSPHKDIPELQWNYPNGWPPMVLICIKALDRFGFNTEAERIAKKWIELNTRIYRRTRAFWEKYNVINGNLNCPGRYIVKEYEGWTTGVYICLCNRLGIIPDTISPEIYDVNFSILDSDSASINWTTDELSTSQIEYGFNTSYGSESTLDDNLVTIHTQILKGLKLRIIYHYRVKSKDVWGNSIVSEDYTFILP